MNLFDIVMISLLWILYTVIIVHWKSHMLTAVEAMISWWSIVDVRSVLTLGLGMCRLMSSQFESGIEAELYVGYFELFLHVYNQYTCNIVHTYK